MAGVLSRHTDGERESKTSRKNNEARNPKKFERLQEHGFGKEPKLLQGLGHNPNAIEVIVWRTFGGIWQQAHDPSWRLRPSARHDTYAFATIKQTNQW